MSWTIQMMILLIKAVKPFTEILKDKNELSGYRRKCLHWLYPFFITDRGQIILNLQY